METNSNLSIDCSGCGAPLTTDNVGGYRCFCRKCVDAFPEFPKDGRGHLIEGQYQNFEWV